MNKTSSIIAFVLFSACLGINIADAQNTPSAQSQYLERLISDILPAYETGKKIAEINSEKSPFDAAISMPTRSNNWASLKIGEFESESAFEERRKQYKNDEEAEYERKLNDTQQLLAQKKQYETIQTQKRADIIANSKNIKPEFVATPPTRSLGGLKPFAVTLKPYMLPRFDRDTMSFRNIAFDPITHDEKYKGNESIQGSFTTPVYQWDIKVENLDEARILKEMFAEGKATIMTVVEAELTGYESPIITKKGFSEEKVVAGNIAGGAIVGLIGALMGADTETIAEGVSDLASDTTRVIHHPDETTEGVRFYFRSNIIGHAILDTDGSILNNIKFIPSQPHTTSVRILDIQRDASLYEANDFTIGDEILTIAGIPVRTNEEAMNLIASKQTGEKYKILYRSVRSGKEHELTATGGNKIGIILITAFKRN